MDLPVIALLINLGNGLFPPSLIVLENNNSHSPNTRVTKVFAMKYSTQYTLTLFCAFLFLWLFAGLLTACSPNGNEPVFQATGTTTPETLLPLSTATAYDFLVEPNVNQNSEEPYYYEGWSIYDNLLEGYADFLADPELPLLTREALLDELPTIQAEATEWAKPIATIDIPHEDMLATIDADLATGVAIRDLTETPRPTPTLVFGLLNTGYGTEIVFTGRGTWGINAWRGYINSDLVFIRTGGNQQMKGIVAITVNESRESYFTNEEVGYGLKIIDILFNRYIAMEGVLDSTLASTSEMYYFDMVAREFMAQPTAELWIENFPGGGGNTLQAQPTLQPQATPTPPIALTISPINPTLHWNTQHTEECWASGGWAIPAEFFPRGGGQETISPEIITTYYLTCFNPVAHTTAWTAPDTGSPSVMSTFTANTQTPLFTTTNTPIALQWSVSYYSGQTCQASGAWSGTKALFGSENIASLPIGKHLFTLTCQKEILSVLVVVEEAPPSPTPTPAPTATPTITPSPTATPTPSPTPALEIKINFQPSGAPVPTGYVVDSGQLYGAQGNGYTYGWDVDITTTARDRNNNASPDQRYDTLVHFQLWPGPYPTKWEVALPNGQYEVRVVAGDPSYTNSVYRLVAEGVEIINGTPTSGTRWFDNTVVVMVSDGKLTLTNGTGANNNKINFIEIRAVAP